MYGSILRQLRESKGRSQADVARSVGISPAHLARLETNQRGLYLEDFIRLTEALGEKPGNLLPNDLGNIGHLKPVIDGLCALKPRFLPAVTAIIARIVHLTEDMPDSTAAPHKPERSRRRNAQRPPPRIGRK